MLPWGSYKTKHWLELGKIIFYFVYFKILEKTYCKMSESKKSTFRKVWEIEHALLLPLTNSSTNLLLETPPPSYPECLQAIMNETDISNILWT